MRERVAHIGGTLPTCSRLGAGVYLEVRLLPKGDRDRRGMTSPARPRVLLVDDHDAILQRAAAVLSKVCVVVGAVRDGPAALKAIDALQPDVVVLDLSMPGMSGLEVAARLRDQGSSVALVFLTVHHDQDFVRAAQSAGGLGFVVKSLLHSDLVTAVMEAHAGRPFVSTML